MRKIFCLLALLYSFGLFGQGIVSTDSIKSPDPDKNYSKALFSDSLSSSFVIVIAKEVKLHYHANHTEQVVVLSGEAEMILGDQTLHIKEGDVIFIPKGTQHAVRVTSDRPLKIVSVQAPIFDGPDRIFIEK